MSSEELAALGPGALRGCRVLLTRPAALAQAAREKIVAAGGLVLPAPCLIERPPSDATAVQRALQEMTRYGWIALTSQSGASALLDALERCDAVVRRALPRVAAVGARTAAVLRGGGVPVALVADADRSGAGLAALLAAQPGAAPVLLLRAEEGREELAEGLRLAGVPVTSVAAYRMEPAPAADLEAACQALRQGLPGVTDLVPFTSPRSAGVLLGALGAGAAQVLRHTRVGAIGLTTARALEAAGVAVTVVGQGDFTGLLLALAATA